MFLKTIQWVFWVVGLGLQILLIIPMFHGAAREFPALFAYVACLLVTTTADILGFLIVGKASASYKTYYWSAELVRQTALFSVVVALAMHVLPTNRRTEAYARTILVVGLAIWIGSVATHYTADLYVWMTSVIRNLSFFTGVLTLVVWFLYAKSSLKDTQRLMIAGGLGLQLTGEAIGQAVRQLSISRNISLGASIFIVLCHFLCLFIWWRALCMRSYRN
jgi:hypothetical protein